MVLDTSLLNTQQYKVRIKGKVEQSMERNSALPYTSGVVAIEKGAFGSPSTKVVDYYFSYAKNAFAIDLESFYIRLDSRNNLYEKIVVKFLSLYIFLYLYFYLEKSLIMNL